MEASNEIFSSNAIVIIGVIINTGIIITTATIGLLHLNSMKKARHAELLNIIFENIHDFSASRERDVFFKLDLSNYDDVKYEDRLLTDFIIDEYNKISYICYKKMLPSEYLYEMYSALFVKIFEHSMGVAFI